MKSVPSVVKRASLQLLLLLGLYSISRILFTLVNASHFKGLTIGRYFIIALNGLRFDLSAVFMLNVVYLVLLFIPLGLLKYRWWRNVLNILFVSVNLLALAFDISDWAYYSFTFKRATADVLGMVSRKGDFWVLLPHFFVDYWYVFLAFALCAFGFIRLNQKIRKAYPVNVDERGGRKLLPRIAMFLVVVAISILGIRGGLQNKPLSIGFALEASEGEYVPLVLNTPFSIINTLSNEKLPELHYYSNEELTNYVQPVKQYSGKPFRPKNVVVIILESFSKQFTGMGKFKSYTPFLDSLMPHAFVCRNAYANALHSAEGIPAVVAGLPSLMEEPFTSSVYSTDRLSALPRLLKGKGYTTAFYHGATNGTMNFDIFCANAGFDNYYGRSEYGNEKDYDGNWGIWDEPYLQYFASMLGKTSQPFLASVFTLSSHDPFKVPEQYRNTLPNGPLPIQKTIAYTDMALRKFFEHASKAAWFNNTLFVITADHCSLMTQDEHDHANMGFYRIPIMFYAPGDSTLIGGSDELMQQIDILPSVLDYLGYDKRFFAFGNSIFRPVAKRYTVMEHSGAYQLVMDNYILKTKNMKPTYLHDFAKDTNCYINLLNKPEGVQLQQKMEPYLKAFIQFYNYSLIHDKMTAEKIAEN